MSRLKIQRQLLQHRFLQQKWLNRGLVKQTIEKTEAMVKAEDTAATAAAPVPAAEMATGLVEQTVEKTEAMVKAKIQRQQLRHSFPQSHWNPPQRRVLQQERRSNPPSGCQHRWLHPLHRQTRP